MGKAPRPLHDADADAEAGFSLVELMVALSIFAVVVAAAATGMDAALDLARNNRQRSTAAYVASQEIEKVRAAFSADTSTPAIGQTSTTTPAVNGLVFTVTKQVSWTNPGSNSDPCMATGTSPTGQVLAYKRVRVRVTWSGMGATQAVSSETLLTPPNASAGLGSLVVTAVDRNNVRLTNLTVLRAANGTTPAETQTIGEDGCVLFTNLPAANYQLTIQDTSSPSYVDLQSGSPPTMVQGVVADSVVAAQFVIDRAASLTVNVTRSPTTAPLPTSGMKMTLAHGTTVNRYAWTPTASTLTPLYPFADGYQAWAGGCADADPEYTGNGGSRGAALTVNPGATTSGNVTMVGQTVLVHTGSSGSPTPVPNRTVQVQAVHGGSATCAGGTETLVYQSVTTGSDGKFTIALPYGTWTLSVSATTPIATSTRTSATVTIRPGQATSQANVRVWS